jgi:flagella basal body P-ring formation protein FlgA
MILAALILLAAPEADCLRVAGERILARDVAAVIPAFAALPADEPLGFAPAPGARRVLTARELALLAERRGIKLEATGGLCVERAARRLDPEQVRAALEAALAASGTPAEARLEIVDFSRYAVPEGELEFARAALPAPPRAGVAVIWRGWVRYVGNRSVAVWARVRLAVSGECVVATQNLGAGRPIEATQVRLERAEWFPFAEAPARDPGQVVGRLPRRWIRAGAPVVLSGLAAPNQVQRGQAIDVEVSSGATQLRFRGRAESGGNAGDAVMVRNPANGRRFAARVEGEGKVVVHANSRPVGAGSVPAVPVGAAARGGRSR